MSTPKDIPKIQFKKDIIPYAIAYLKRFGKSTARQLFNYGMEHGLFQGRVSIEPRTFAAHLCTMPEVVEVIKSSNQNVSQYRLIEGV